jgi:hypothetical protein
MDENEFIEHLKDDHQNRASGSQLLAIISAARTSVPKAISSQKCPLCFQDGWKSQRNFATHVSRHMEEIALGCLPKDMEDEDESCDDEDKLQDHPVQDQQDGVDEIHEVCPHCHTRGWRREPDGDYCNGCGLLIDLRWERSIESPKSPETSFNSGYNSSLAHEPMKDFFGVPLSSPHEPQAINFDTFNPAEERRQQIADGSLDDGADAPTPEASVSEYPVQPTQSDPYEWQRQGGTVDTERGNLAYNDRPATSESYGPAAGTNRTMPTSADQSGGQRLYTREEVEKLVARELRKAGKREVSTEIFRQIVDQQLAKLVDEHFKALQRGQQGQQGQQTQQTQQTQQPKTGETRYPKTSAEDPPDKPNKPSQPDPRGSYTSEEPRSILFDTKSRTSEISYPDTYPERADRGQQSQTQRAYEEPTRSLDSFSRSTQEQRKEMEQKIVRALKEKGLTTVTREQLDDAIDRALQRLADDPGSQPDTTQSVSFHSKYATSGATDPQRHRRRD